MMCSENDSAASPQEDEQGMGINARRKQTIQLTVGHNLARGETPSYFAGSIFVTKTILALPSTRPLMLTFRPASSRAFC